LSKIQQKDKSIARTPPWQYKISIMTKNVFIDGEAGTTGLQVQARLNAHPDISLISLDDQHRKDPAARRDAMASADAVILCLPDEAAVEAVTLAEGLDCIIIDASTAHRIDPGWVYGFPELCPGQRDAIRQSRRIANVGCYATAMIAMIRPLIDRGLMGPETRLFIPASSGYTGGGKGLIAYMDKHDEARHFSYALGLSHKHLPEVMHHAGLETKPVFMPMVGDYDCGMIVHLPLVASQLQAGVTRAQLFDAYASHYDGEAFIGVFAPDDAAGLTDEGFFAADALKGTNRLGIHLFGNDDEMLVMARLDNLGKGASGAAVQNLNIALGLDEHAGLGP
jgi:N-acetyl-gamma-glutamyl-phosphate reductase|tara:strand:+ start:716 stop:1726 length:1011 start_codon:yes stop_codon:yes gene_type:complete